MIVGEPAIMHGQRVVPVIFSPLSYDPRTGELAAARTMTVEITFGGRDARNDVTGAPRPIPASFATIFEDAIVGWQRDANVVTGPGTYLMICPNDAAVVSAVQPLARLARAPGLPHRGGDDGADRHHRGVDQGLPPGAVQDRWTRRSSSSPSSATRPAP